MISAFFRSKKWFWWAYGGGLFICCSLYAQVEIAVLLNSWRREFYDILQEATKHNLSEFWAQLLKFTHIVIPFVILATITNYITRLFAFRWREAMTFDYIPRWRNTEGKIEGASQRIQEDTFRFARIVETLGIQAIKAIMTLIAFLPILWGLSESVDLAQVKGITGSLVWLALITSIGGMIISWLVGLKLPGLEYNNQRVEAVFRKELVYGEDDKLNFASHSTLATMFTGIRLNYHRLYLHYGYFDIWGNLYAQIMIIAPYVFIGPGLFSGLITLGVLSQVVSAFDEVHSSFSIFINNWTTITELRSIRKRLYEFEQHIRIT